MSDPTPPARVQLSHIASRQMMSGDFQVWLLDMGSPERA
jgi:hypothetical protein